MAMQFQPDKMTPERGTIGKTVTRLKALGEPKRDIRPSIDKARTNPEEKQEHDPSTESGRLEIKEETFRLASIFITPVWNKINTFVQAHPPGILMPYTGGMVSIKDAEELVSREHDLHGKRVAVLTFLSSTIDNFISEWKGEMEELARLQKPLTEDEARTVNLYKRYKTVVGLGLNSVLEKRRGFIKDGEPRALPTREEDNHIRGGFATALSTILGLAEVATEVYQDQVSPNANPEEISALIESARPIILTVSQGDVNLLASFQESLLQETDIFGLIKFDPNKFYIVKKGNKMFLEIKDENLAEIERTYKSKIAQPNRMGCPAILSPGTKGSHTINEMFDWSLGLYKKLVLENSK